MEAHLNKRYIYEYAFVICLGSFVFGTEQSMSTAFRLKNEASETLRFVQTYLLPGVFYLGGVSGCVISGLIIAWGRRTMLLFSDLAFFVGTVPMLIPSLPKAIDIEDYYYFLPGRFLSGLAIGIFSVDVPLFLKEISAPGLYGRMWSLHALLIIFGEMVEQWVCFEIWVDGTESASALRFLIGKLAFLLPAFAAMAQLLLISLYWKVDTPKFYLSIGAEIECLESLAKTYARGRTTIAYNDLCTNRDLLRYKRATYRNMFSKTYVWGITVITVFLFLRGFSGFSALLVYAGHIYKKEEEAVNAFLTAVACGSCFFAFLVSDRLGRRPLLFYGSMAIFFINLLSFCTLIMDGFPAGTYEHKELLLALAAIYVGAYWASVGSVGFAFFTEFLPDPGCAIGQMAYWGSIGSSVMAFSAVTGGGAVCEKPSIVCFFFVFTLSSFFLIFWSYYTIQETAQKSEYEAMCLYSLDEEDRKRKSAGSNPSSLLGS